MNHLHVLAIAVTLAAGTAALAQQPVQPPAGQMQPATIATAPVERHLAVLTEKLELTADQQEKVRPILQRMHDASVGIGQDESISTQERNEQMHAQMMKADQQVRVILNDEQKKKLDVLEQDMHHGTAAPQK